MAGSQASSISQQSVKSIGATGKRFASFPGNNLQWNLSAADILRRAEMIMQQTKVVYDQVGSLTTNQINYNSVIKILAEDTINYYTVRLPLHFIQHVYSQQDLKEASMWAEKKLSDFDLVIGMRDDVFHVLVEAQKIFGSTLEPEASRYLNRLITLGKRNGLHLSKPIQREIAETLKSMNDQCNDFIENLTNENTILRFTAQQLDGLPPDVLNTFEKTPDGRYKVTLKGRNYLQCMKFVKDADVRMKLDTAFNSRCMKENTLILDNLVKLRHKKARILQYQNHAAYVLDLRMAKTPERVTAFLYDLETKLKPLKDDDIALLLQYKREDCEKNNRGFDNKINLWDMRYYMTRVEERKYAVDHNALREYFPLSTVTKGLLDIYQELLGLKFQMLEGAEVWDPEVTFYSTKDKATDTLIGYFYLDLFPRNGKYGQAACFSLQPTCVLGDGRRQLAIAALVANFPRQTADHPALLSHDEVETFFHEFGHLMHQLCSETDFVLFSGANVEKDFVETPSYMLENWCWERESLVRMSAHYKDGSGIPNNLLTALVESRRANGGINAIWQVLLSKFDQAIHASGEVHTAELFEDMSKKITGIEPIRGTCTPATFSHMVAGYDGQYYSYLWSEVNSADMFVSRFKTEGLRNPKTGMDYRSMILKPGGSLDADSMIRTFLGRDVNPQAFFVVRGFVK